MLGHDTLRYAVVHVRDDDVLFARVFHVGGGKRTPGAEGGAAEEQKQQG